MRKLNKLMEFLPYYFKGSDTYKDSNGKGLLEKYLEIFGNYFEDIIVNDTKSLDGILDIDNTSQIYLGYLWDFLGQLPYANPKAVDPEKWKAYFNGFDDDNTISELSSYWLYPKDTVSNDLVLTEGQVRQLLKYSVTLFKIRGTEKFFKTLLALYGIDVEILDSQSSQILTGDYYSNGNIHTKLDGTEATLNQGCTMDFTNVCNTCASIHFVLHIPSQVWNNVTQDTLTAFIRKVEKVIKRFLPINVRVVFEWLSPNDDRYKITNAKILRPFVLVDSKPSENCYFYTPGHDSTVVASVFTTNSRWPGWYIYNPTTVNNMKYYAGVSGYTLESVVTKLSELNWVIGNTVRVMVMIVPVDSVGNILNDKTDEELDPIRFTINNGDIEYENGHVFNITIGASKEPIGINPKPVLLDPSWEAWYDQDLPVYFNCLLKRVSYKFGVDFNGTVVVDFDYGDHGSIPIISYKEVASIVNGTIVSTESSPVDFIWNNDINNPVTPEPMVLDPTRYRATIEPTTSGEQYFYMVENPSKRFIIETNVNKLRTTVIPSPSVLQLTDDNPTKVSRLDVMLGTYQIHFDLPRAFDEGYYVSDELSNWFTNNLDISEARGNCKAYYSGTFTVKSSSLNPVILNNQIIEILIPVLSRPVHNNSQYLEITCNGTIVEDGEDVSVTLKARINLLTRTIAFTQIYTDNGKVLTGVESIYGRLQRAGHNNVILINIEPIDDVYNLAYIDFNLSILAYGLSTVLTITPSTLSWQVETLSYSDLIIREIHNKENKYNLGELANFSKPGVYTFKASYLNDPTFSLVTAISGTVDVNGLFNSGIKYTLEVIDDDMSDNKADTIRMPYRFDNSNDSQAVIPVIMNLFTNLTQVEGIDMETLFPDSFDWTIDIIWGSNPMGDRLASIELDDDSYNVVVDPYTEEEKPADNYGKTGTFNFTFNKVVTGEGQERVVGDRDYTPVEVGDTDYPDGNFPPGLYTIMMHSKSPMIGQDYYQVIELYEARDPNERQIHIDVEVISRAWIDPIGVTGDTDAKKTWGYYKSHMEAMVTNASYDVHIEVPEFRVLLSNNNIGYKKVWLYRLLPRPSFDQDDTLDVLNSKDIIYTRDGEEWIKTEGTIQIDDPLVKTWVFTGTVYNLGELVKGPEEPGSYMLVVHQTAADKVIIGKAYLLVKEIANYTLFINPTAAVLEEEDTAVSTQIDVTNDAIWPEKLRLYSAATHQWLNVIGSGTLAQTIFPVTFLAYTAGTYNFTIYWWDENSTGIDPVTGQTSHWVPLHSTLGLLEGTFNVVRNTSLSPESRVWTHDGSNVILTVDLVMVSSEASIPWAAIISEDQ